MTGKFLYLLIFVMLGTSAAFSQYDMNVEDDVSNDPPPRKGYRTSLALDVTAPHLFYNPANAEAFNGIASVNANYSIRLVKEFSIGAYAYYTGFNISSYKYGLSNPLSTSLSFGIQLQYEIFIGGRFSYMPSVQAGPRWIMYQHLNKPPKDVDDSPRTTIDDWGFSIQQNNTFYYYVTNNKRVAIGATIGFNYFSHEFSKKDTGLNSTAAADLQPYSDKGPTIHMNFGLGFITKIGVIH